MAVAVYLPGKGMSIQIEGGDSQYLCSRRKEINSPYLARVVTHKRAPVVVRLAVCGTRPLDLPHILLDRTLAHPNVQLEQLSPDALTILRPETGTACACDIACAIQRTMCYNFVFSPCPWWESKAFAAAILAPESPYIYGNISSILDKHYYTFCTLERLQNGLRHRDIFVSPSERWGDPRAQLL